MAWWREGESAFVPPKGYENLAQGGGFAEPWVDVIHVVRPEGAIEQAFSLFQSQSGPEPAR